MSQSSQSQNCAQTTQEMRADLIEMIKARSFRTGSEMKLASGRTSSFYVNMKPTMLHPHGAYLIGSLVNELISDQNIDMVGGLEMGAVPLATAVAMASYLRGTPLPAFFVRKQAKEHGTQARIDGLPDGEQIAGCKVLIVEDVTTTGGSALKAVETVREAGGDVALVVTLVDRHEGAKTTFAEANIPFRALLTIEDFRDAGSGLMS